MRTRRPERATLKIVIKENLYTWKWSVYGRNPAPNKWDRKAWLHLACGTTLTKGQAKGQAKRAVKKIRKREMKLKEIVYYDPPGAAADS
ncbi:MAG: hypothetical protein WBW44_10845 [Solirubrobacterales bacterium]